MGAGAAGELAGVARPLPRLRRADRRLPSGSGTGRRVGCRRRHLGRHRVELRGSTRVWVGCGLGWALLCLGWIDWEQFRLPDALTLPLIIAGLLAAWVLDRGAVTDHAAAAMLGYAGLRLVNAVYLRLRNRDGLGAGDAKLFAACGAWVGLAPLPSVLLFAALAEIAIAVARGLAGEQLRATTRLPFGACLAGALWAVWLLMDRA